MTEPRVVELIGKRIAITDAMRAEVVAELPEIESISDPALRRNVTDALGCGAGRQPLLAHFRDGEALRQLRHTPAPPRNPG